MKKLFFYHKIAIVLAILTSIIAVFPQAYFRINHYDDGIYQDIELLPNSPWLGRVREIKDGNGFGGIYYKDGKDDPYLLQPLGSIVVAYMGTALFLDIGNTFLISAIILSFITFLLLYYFIFLISKDKLVSVAGATVVLYTQPVISFTNLSQLLNGTIPNKFWELSQSVNPAMIYILFFGFLISFWLFYQKRTWQLGVVSAIVLGLNFYNYFYTWTYLYAFGGILALIFIIQKKWLEVKIILSIFVGALLVAIPYMYNLYSATQHPNYEALSARFAVINSHSLLFVGMSVSIALIVFLIWFPREDKKRYFFGLALLLTPFITMNQQIITGKILQAGHYHWYFHRPIAIVFFIITVFCLLKRYGKNFGRKSLVLVLILISFVVVSIVQVNTYFNGYHTNESIAIKDQKYGPVMEWLNDNVKKESTILTNNYISKMIVIYTSLNVFYHHSALHSLSATKDRLIDQQFTFYRLQEIGEEDVQEVFERDKAQISAELYGLYYRDLYQSTGDIPIETLDEIITLYKNSLSISTLEWLKQKMKQYDVDYIVWDKKADPNWQLQKYSFFKEVAKFGDLIIYSFNQ